MNSNRLIPLLLIAFGVSFLLRNLGLITFSPWDVLWPGLIIGFGANQLYKIFRGRGASHNSAGIALWLIVVAIGFYLLFPVLGIPAPKISGKVFWPLILILVGLLKLLPGGNSIIYFDFSNGDTPTKSSFVGEINRGPNWIVDDMKIHHSIGAVNLDLTQAMIPDKEVTLEIAGHIGSTTIYLPPGLSFKAECALKLGDLTVLEQNESGFQNYIYHQSSDYETATQKVNIKVRWKIGEIRIHQIQ